MTPVDVEIFGRKYRLRGDDPSKIKEYASYLNNLLEDVQGKLDTIDLHEIYSLASMMLVEEVFKQKEEYKTLKNDVQDVSSVLDDYINEEI